MRKLTTLTAPQVMRKLGGITRGRLTQLEKLGLKPLDERVKQSGGGKVWDASAVELWRSTYKVNRRMQRMGTRSHVKKIIAQTRRA